MGGASYQYDGEGRRVQQTISSTITKYLLDIQPGLAVVLSETTGANTMRHVHSPRGIHAHKDTGGNWEWMVQDGLGSVREVVDNTVNVLESRNYDPYGNPFGAIGTSQTGYGFTGELVDGSGLLDLRARRYNAGIGVFASLDPLETPNRYAYVDGNPINSVDPSGNYGELPSNYAGCTFDIMQIPTGTPTSNVGAIPVSPLTQDQLAQSIVAIALGDSKDRDTCSSPYQVSGNLGTLTTRLGIMTHDHMIHSGINDTSATPVAYQTEATTPVEAAQYMRSWPCITFTGAYSSLTIKGKDLRVDLSKSVPGTLFLEAAQIDALGQQQSLLQLGLAVNEDLNWKPKSNEVVWVSHVNGPNDQANFLAHDIGFFELPVDVAAGLVPNSGRIGYKTVNQWVTYWTDITEPGDSGGGVFSQNGYLVGVNLGVVGGTYPVNRQFIHYFVPL